MLDTIHHHEPGVFKQQNKAHRKLGHRSKREINAQNRGRVNIVISSKKSKKSLQRIERRNQLKQNRIRKREIVINAKRSIGIGQSPPHLTALIPLHQAADVSSLSTLIQESVVTDQSFISTPPLQSAGFTANIPRLKHRFQFISPGTASYSDILSCALVADAIVFIAYCDECEPIDSHGCNILSCLLAQGISSMVFCTQGIKDIAPKMRNPIKKEIVKKLNNYISNVKFFVVDHEQDTFNMLRSVADIKRNKIGLRYNRPYMIIEKQNFVPAENDDSGTLEITGHIRGSSLNINQIIHVVGWGDFQISRVDEVAEHCPWNIRRNANTSGGIHEKMVLIRGKSFHSWELTGNSLEPDPSLQQDISPIAEVDPMDGEQTWPTKEELEEAEEATRRRVKKSKRVPEGTSEYQAAWILDSDEDWEELEDEEDEGKMEEDLEPNEEEMSQIDACSIDMTSESIISESPSLLDVADDPKALDLYREERSHEMFPDEVDTPKDVPARVRFQKYRGLQSFRTSPWDPKENLPLDYSKIFQFQSFERTKKRVKSTLLDDDHSFKSGAYVTVHVKNVPRSFVTEHPSSSPLIVFGLFPHEQKMSVLHLAIKQTGSETIKNKSELLFYVGFRRFRANPIFSEHTTGSKHKMERFFPKDGVVVASMFAPIMFPPANVVVFSESKGECHLVATGALYKVDPDRVITKRVVLSGPPWRIHKKGAVVRFMFFNREDVLWFKPVELRTKYGRRGHIKEPVGTHGHMKCVFDSQLTSQDTVLMNLYKRVFSNWTYQQVTPLQPVITSRCVTADENEIFDDRMFE